MANQSDKKTYDVVVIGGGPGGYVAAIRASQLGLKTAIVERENLGGVCLNWGCIPTKALLRAAEIYHLAETADRFGITMEKLSFDLASVVKRSRDVAATLSGGISHLMKKNKIENHPDLNGAGMRLDLNERCLLTDSGLWTAS